MIIDNTSLKKTKNNKIEKTKKTKKNPDNLISQCLKRYFKIAIFADKNIITRRNKSYSKNFTILYNNL